MLDKLKKKLGLQKTEEADKTIEAKKGQCNQESCHCANQKLSVELQKLCLHYGKKP